MLSAGLRKVLMEVLENTHLTNEKVQKDLSGCLSEAYRDSCGPQKTSGCAEAPAGTGAVACFLF